MPDPTSTDDHAETCYTHAPPGSLRALATLAESRHADPLTRHRALALLRDELDTHMQVTAHEARAAGHTWHQIGAAAGRTKQAAHTAWRTPIETPEDTP